MPGGLPPSVWDMVEQLKWFKMISKSMLTLENVKLELLLLFSLLLFWLVLVVFFPQLLLFKIFFYSPTEASFSVQLEGSLQNCDTVIN